MQLEAFSFCSVICYWRQRKEWNGSCFRTSPGAVITVSAGMQGPPAAQLAINPTSFGATTTVVIGSLWWGRWRRAELIVLHKSACTEPSWEKGVKGLPKGSVLPLFLECFCFPVREGWGRSPGFRVQLQLDKQQRHFPWPPFKSIVTAATMCFLPVRSSWFLPSPQHSPLCRERLLWRADKGLSALSISAVWREKQTVSRELWICEHLPS